MFDAIPYFMALEGDATDETLKKDCFTVLYVLASAQQKESTIQHLLDILLDVQANGSWHARMFLLRFLQIMVFTNLPFLKVRRMGRMASGVGGEEEALEWEGERGFWSRRGKEDSGVGRGKWVLEWERKKGF